jgi:hypothetical protein
MLTGAGRAKIAHLAWPQNPPDFALHVLPMNHDVRASRLAQKAVGRGLSALALTFLRTGVTAAVGGPCQQRHRHNHCELSSESETTS